MSENNAVPPPRSRTVGVIHPEEGDALVAVEHVYAPEGAFACDDCGAPGHDPGMVSLFVDDADDDKTTVLLTAAEALVLANRLQRAAGLILESAEDAPDVEREAARFAKVPDVVPQPDAADPVKQAVWQAWNAIGDDEPSPVKRVARQLEMKPFDVAAIVYPFDQFGWWGDAHEPDLPDDGAGAEQ